MVFCVLIPCCLVSEYLCYGGVLLPYFGGLFYFITEQGRSFNVTTVCVDVFDIRGVSQK